MSQAGGCPLGPGCPNKFGTRQASSVCKGAQVGKECVPTRVPVSAGTAGSQAWLRGTPPPPALPRGRTQLPPRPRHVLLVVIYFCCQVTELFTFP